MPPDDIPALSVVAEFPGCVIPCVIQHCATSNITCVCGPDKGAIIRCVDRSCPMPEAIFSRNITERTCQTPVRNETVRFNVMVISMTTFAGLVLISRLLFRQFFSSTRRLNVEDWIGVAIIPLAVPSAALTIFGLTAHGLGVDIWGLPRTDVITFGHYFYIVQILYILLITLVKLQLTFFYLSIFSGRAIAALLWSTVIFHIAVAMAFIIGIIFQCLPIRFQWEMYDYIHHVSQQGHCININAAGWAHGAISIVSDIWLLGIPLSQVQKLTLHWRKKLAAGLMFLTGAIVTIISILRLASIKKYASTSNPTWDEMNIVWWSVIEVAVGVVCTCLPTMRLILKRIAQRLFASGSSKATQASGHVAQPRFQHSQGSSASCHVPLQSWHSGYGGSSAAAQVGK